MQLRSSLVPFLVKNRESIKLHTKASETLVSEAFVCNLDPVHFNIPKTKI